MDKLPLDAKIALITKMAIDYDFYSNEESCPEIQSFSISYPEESRQITRQARLAAFESYKPIVKQAFDTRRTNQVTERNPRRNLQFYHRAEPFIDEDENEKLNRFAKLMKVTANIKNEYGNEPEWFDSYARQLHEGLERALRVKEADLVIFKPQLKYLEQLVYARYRITMEDMNKCGEEELKKIILGKDESLIKRGAYLKETGNVVIKDGNNKNVQDSIVNAIFGAPIRKDGERTVERVITISVVDKVID
jgi:hypothetical protein